MRGTAWTSPTRRRKSRHAPSASSPCTSTDNQWTCPACATSRAATGRALSPGFDAMKDRRRALAARYDAALAGLPLGLPSERAHARHVYHLFVVRTDRRDKLAGWLKERGIQTGVHYPVPSHRQPSVENLAAPALPQTERLVDEILTLPISSGHSDEEIDRVAAA